MFIVLLCILILIVATWTYGFYISNNFSVKNGDISKYKKALAIFPHPDDETLSSGGLLKNFTTHGSDVTIVVLTKGERGNDDAHVDLSLKKTRKQELVHATKALGVQHLILEDFGDGELTKRRNALTTYIDKLLSKEKPDLVLTYDLSGLYGHEDHIVVSEIVTTLISKKFPKIKLLYPSLPIRIFDMITLPEHMAKNPEYSKRRVLPTMKIFVGKNIFYRIRALYAYKSQLYSFRKSFPIPLLPLWFYYSMQFFEYYHEAN